MATGAQSGEDPPPKKDLRISSQETLRQSVLSPAAAQEEAQRRAAAALTAFGFVLGPFVYLGHEMLWDYYSAPRQRRPGLPVPTNAALPIGGGSNAEVEPA